MQYFIIFVTNFVIILSMDHLSKQASSRHQNIGTQAKARKVGRIQIPAPTMAPIKRYRAWSFLECKALLFVKESTTKRRRKANNMASAVLENVRV